MQDIIICWPCESTLAGLTPLEVDYDVTSAHQNLPFSC